MFSKKIIDSGAFLDMPLSAQCLYFHLNMRADDEGVVDNVRQIMRMIGANEDDIKMLLSKAFLLVVEGEVVVIKEWYIHNTLKKDRTDKSLYHDQLATIYSVDENKKYTLNGNILEPNRNPSVSIDKYSIDKSSIDKDVCDSQLSINIYKDDEKETKTSDDDAKDDIETDKVAEALMKYIPTANTIWFEKVESYRSKKLSDELIIKAIENTALANTRDCRYFMAICEEYIAKGYKSAVEVDEAKKSYKNKKSGQGMSRDAYNDWFEKNILANV